MGKHQRIVHTADRNVNDCSCEFLVVNAGNVSELQDQGYVEVGRTNGLVNADFPQERGWIPNIRIVPVGGLAEVDRKLKSKFKGRLFNLVITNDGDTRAIDTEKRAEEMALSVHVDGDLYLVNYTHTWFSTREEDHTELFLIDSREKSPHFRYVPHKGIQWWDTDHNPHMIGVGSGSSIGGYVGSYPLRVNKIERVGEMEVAPAFLQECRTSPRMGHSGSMDYKPRLSRYVDFQRHLKDKAERDAKRRI